ncbi:hypothetical protein E1B28_001459 [Marasmius oreades]|uniref:Uncharacterized protein n=1 Tax=Marasmius oreades TaxID=181124 RepID=A0A9P7V3J2_9AGAR|nr:uncharacterized protein E1B28_001459 [Marasmius oreades]KAG7099631.1 hypothetical protein E1B28_001459 [Marasmius oreades]
MGDKCQTQSLQGMNSWRFMDPDISGPGVRISFYLQTLFLVVLVNRSWQDAPIALWTCITMSFGLTIAAMANINFITLLEVLQVCNLVWLANIGIFVSLASYSRQKAGSRKARSSRNILDYRVKFGAMIQTLFSMAMTVYMWSRVETIGCLAAQPAQAEIQYVFFLWGTEAVGTGKRVGLAFSSFFLAIYTGLSLHELFSFYRNRRRKVREDFGTKTPTIINQTTVPVLTGTPTPLSPAASDDSPATPNLVLSHPISINPISPLNLGSCSHSANSSQSRRPKRRRWSSGNLDPMLVGILIIEFLVWTYFVVSCEQLIAKNKANDGEAAGFGQVCY